jgi:hypothetical protein
MIGKKFVARYNGITIEVLVLDIVSETSYRCIKQWCKTDCQDIEHQKMFNYNLYICSVLSREYNSKIIRLTPSNFIKIIE